MTDEAKTELAKCRRKGWLDFGDKTYSADDRMHAGEKLAADFFEAGFALTPALDYAKPRVDNSRRSDLPERVYDAQNRYLRAMACLTSRQAFTVRTICCMDKAVKIPLIHKAQYVHELELMKHELCGGLDRLCAHYWGKPSASDRRKIAGFSTVNFWDGFDDCY